MADTQVILRIEKDTLREFDDLIARHGFKTRNEWFRAKVREFIIESKRERMEGMLQKLNAEGVSEDDIVRMVREWRRGRDARDGDN